MYVPRIIRNCDRDPSNNRLALIVFDTVSMIQELFIHNSLSLLLLQRHCNGSLQHLIFILIFRSGQHVLLMKSWNSVDSNMTLFSISTSCSLLKLTWTNVSDDGAEFFVLWLSLANFSFSPPPGGDELAGISLYAAAEKVTILSGLRQIKIL